MKEGVTMSQTEIETFYATQDKIYIILDNARYYRNKILTEYLKTSKIEFMFLPPYSPNLNLVERVWKFTKKRCLNSKYYSDFSLFRNAISGFLENMHCTHAAELKTLLSLEFQMFTNDQIDTAV